MVLVVLKYRLTLTIFFKDKHFTFLEEKNNLFYENIVISERRIFVVQFQNYYSMDSDLFFISILSIGPINAGKPGVVGIF